MSNFSRFKITPSKPMTLEEEGTFEDAFEGITLRFGEWDQGKFILSGEWYSFESDAKIISTQFGGQVWTFQRIGPDGQGEKIQVLDGKAIRRDKRAWIPIL